MPKKETKKTKKFESKAKYIEKIGRRKTAVARVRGYPGAKDKVEITINGKSFKDYFPQPKDQKTVQAPFDATGSGFKVSVSAKGGGLNAQAESIRLGLSRILVEIDEGYKSKLKKLGFLTRDPRMVERKKPGLPKARKTQQWRKR